MSATFTTCRFPTKASMPSSPSRCWSMSPTRSAAPCEITRVLQARRLCLFGDAVHAAGPYGPLRFHPLRLSRPPPAVPAFHPDQGRHGPWAGRRAGWSLEYFLLSFFTSPSKRKYVRVAVNDGHRSDQIFRPHPVQPRRLARCRRGVYFFGTKAGRPISDREFLKFYRGRDVIYDNEQDLTALTGYPF